MALNICYHRHITEGSYSNVATLGIIFKLQTRFSEMKLLHLAKIPERVL